MAISMSSKLEATKIVIWPAVVLLMTSVFYRPLYTAADHLAKNMGNLEKLKIGQLELNLRASDLPVPTDETAKVLKSFSDLMFTELLSIKGDGGPCFQDPNLESNPKYLALRELARLEQITFVPNKKSEDFCPNSHATRLTKNGEATKKFVIDLMATQFGVRTATVLK